MVTLSIVLTLIFALIESTMKQNTVNCAANWLNKISFIIDALDNLFENIYTLETILGNSYNMGVNNIGTN